MEPNDYLKVPVAVDFQGMLILACVAIYAWCSFMDRHERRPHRSHLGLCGYTVPLCFCLFKTGMIAHAL